MAQIGSAPIYLPRLELTIITESDIHLIHINSFTISDPFIEINVSRGYNITGLDDAIFLRIATINPMGHINSIFGCEVDHIKKIDSLKYEYIFSNSCDKLLKLNANSVRRKIKRKKILTELLK